MENIKDSVKANKETLDLPTFEIKYSTYNKMIPISLERIIEIYPIAEFPDMYNITLSAKA
jgi:hypothetical protein